MVALFYILKGCGQEIDGKVHKTFRAFGEKDAIQMEGGGGVLGTSHPVAGLSFHCLS